MRVALWLMAAAVTLTAVACLPATHATKSPGSSARTEASPTVPDVTSQAANLRTHLDLLLSEQVMIVAKETAAAANHEDAYAGYTALLTSNQTDLANVVRTSIGDTAADGFARSWSAQNTALVDYGIGVVTHNDAKASQATSEIGAAMQQLASRISDMSGLASDGVVQLVTQQAAYDKAFIDDAGSQSYPRFYADLDTAYLAAERLGDALAARIADRYPDRFPGDPTVPSVDRRVSVNVLLQQHALLVTMATDAVVGGRAADLAAANAALDRNTAGISRTLDFPAFVRLWSTRIAAVMTYANKGDAASRQALMATGPQLASAFGIGPSTVTDELVALVKVIDDQRAKASDRVAGDDRAAATSMQPLGDAIGLGPTI